VHGKISTSQVEKVVAISDCHSNDRYDEECKIFRSQAANCTATDTVSQPN
jgi:hypothetical protein